MKYCKNCGAQVEDEAVVCVSCGCAVNEQPAQPVYAAQPAQSGSGSTLKLLAKIFMVLGCLAYGWCLIPLCWTIPMTVHYFNATKNNQPVGIGFKVCSLLFVSLLGGIFMLCANDNN